MVYGARLPPGREAHPTCAHSSGTADDLAEHLGLRVEVAACCRFWQCPNGKDCKYRHALPPGYVLKSQMKELLEAERANAPSIEEEIEAERAKVDARTPITEDVSKIVVYSSCVSPAWRVWTRTHHLQIERAGMAGVSCEMAAVEHTATSVHQGVHPLAVD